MLEHLHSMTDIYMSQFPSSYSLPAVLVFPGVIVIWSCVLVAGFGSFLLANPLIKEREVFKSEKTEVVRTSSVR